MKIPAAITRETSVRNVIGVPSTGSEETIYTVDVDSKSLSLLKYTIVLKTENEVIFL